MAFTPRTTAPRADNRFYYKDNPFYQSGYGLPNCTCHAFGRAFEIMGTKPKLSLRNAENWWDNTTDGYQRGQMPKLGATGCWKKGKVGVGSDGAGHVATVEKIEGNKVTFSMSDWGGKKFYWKTFTIGNYNYNGLVFQGFIYNPAVKAKYVVGSTYTLQTNLNVRKGPGTNHAIKQVSELTADGKKNATKKSGGATLKKGTKVTCLEINGDWMRVPSGWLCCGEGNDVYIA